MKAPLEQRFHAKYVREPISGCWIWIGSDNGRYGLIAGGGKQLKAHRVSYQLHHGQIPDGMVVMHACDNPLCVNPEHLRVGTQLDNIKDRDVKGRQVPNMPIGSSNGMHKLTDSDVLNIRQLRSEGWKVVKIAERFGVTHGCISNITNGKSWTHI